MPVQCTLVDGEYKVVNADTGKVEHNHGQDQESCEAQAAAINANAEETRGGEQVPHRGVSAAAARLDAGQGDAGESRTTAHHGPAPATSPAPISEDDVDEAKGKYRADPGKKRGRQGGGSKGGFRRRGSEQERLDVGTMSPGFFLATLEQRDYPQLCRDSTHLRFHLGRLLSLREERPTVNVGAWGVLAMVEALESLDAERSVAEDELMDFLFQVDMMPPHVGMADPGPAFDSVFVEREGGIHPHGLEDDGGTELGGRHSHAFLFRGEVHFTECDGAHTHDAGEDDRTADETDHVHQAFVEVDGDMVPVEFGGTTPHGHEVLVETTTVGGLHQHTAAEVDGNELTTLSPVEFRALFGTAMEARAAEAVGSFLAKLPTVRVLERVAESSGEWEVTIIQAGLSKNLNYWPAELLEERGATIFENVPLEALKFSPTDHGHAKSYNPHGADLPAGVVANSVGVLTDVRFVPDGGEQPTQEQAQAIAKVMGTSVEEVMAQSKGRIVAIAKLDESELGKDINAKLEFAADEGLLANYLGLSVDIAEAAPVRVMVKGPDGRRQTISVRPEINEAKGVLVDFVSRPSAGGQVEGKAAA